MTADTALNQTSPIHSIIPDPDLLQGSLKLYSTPIPLSYSFKYIRFCSTPRHFLRTNTTQPAIMASHPAKRKPAAPNNNFSAAAARKRQKTFDARSLAVQAADAALSASGELDVAAYVEAREYEIRSLESGIQRSKNALTSRAFQKVPRSLRRRTASHNVKRVPKRLRARAKREVYSPFRQLLGVWWYARTRRF